MSKEINRNISKILGISMLAFTATACAAPSEQDAMVEQEQAAMQAQAEAERAAAAEAEAARQAAEAERLAAEQAAQAEAER